MLFYICWAKVCLMGHYFLISEMDALRLAGNGQEAGLAGNLTNLLMSALAPGGTCPEVGRMLLPTTALLKILSVEHRSKGLKILGSLTVPPSSAWVVLSSLVPELWGQIPISSCPPPASARSGRHVPTLVSQVGLW